MREGTTGLDEFQADVEGFSGPFDLLCHLVETGQLEVASISLGEVVRIYGAYLANTRKVSVGVVSNFLSMAASLVLKKIHALFPVPERPADDLSGAVEAGGEDVLERLSRYRPYRRAAERLLDRKERQDRFFLRLEPDAEEQTWYLGDLYRLCRLWWSLLETRKRTLRSSGAEGDVFLPGIPVSVPDEELIENRMAELRASLAASSVVRLSELLPLRGASSLFIVTILALLELSRAGTIRIVQKELFHDLFIRAL